MLGRLLDIGEGQIPVLVGNADDLIEPRDSVSDVTASVIGSLRCFGKAKTLFGKSLRSVSSPCFS
jgi:hypothetical protein